MFRLSSHVSVLCLAVVSVTLAGCGSPSYAPSPGVARPVVEAKRAPAKPETVTHQFNITAVDAFNKPLPGVDVEVKLTGKTITTNTVKCVTGADGSCEPVTHEVPRDLTYAYTQSYSSSADVTGSKEGFYTAKGRAFIIDVRKVNNSDNVKLRMIRPLDYLDANFATSAADRDLRARVLKFLEVIKLQSLLTDSEVMLGGVGTSEFKGKKYLRVRVNSTTLYNSLKLDKYDIGKRLYDETVRKLLNPLNDHIAAPKAYSGYDIVVYGYTKNLTQEYATPAKIEYRFLLPESAVRRYKEKDISGQALLDAGVLLMDDERVEFKLQ